MKRTLTTLAFAALAAPVVAQNALPGDEQFNRMAADIQSRSLKACDPALDVPNLSAKREEMLMLRSVRTRQADGTITLMIVTGIANNANMNVCLDERLKDTPYEAVVYADSQRTISINPNAADPEVVLVKGYTRLKAAFDQFNAGTLSEEQLSKPIGILPDGVTAAAPPLLAPRVQVTLRAGN